MLVVAAQPAVLDTRAYLFGIPVLLYISTIPERVTNEISHSSIPFPLSHSLLSPSLPHTIPFLRHTIPLPLPLACWGVKVLLYVQPLSIKYYCQHYNESKISGRGTLWGRTRDPVFSPHVGLLVAFCVCLPTLTPRLYVYITGSVVCT